MTSFLVKRGITCEVVLALDWEYDWDFIRLAESACHATGLRTLTVSPSNIAEILCRLRLGDLDCRLLFDRASGATPDFQAFQNLALEREWDVIEPVDKLRWASDKATMHLEFIAHGIRTPYTLILPSYESQKSLSLRREDLAPLGTPFIIKPANTTGGSLGVVHDAAGLEAVWPARLRLPRDKYLLQEKVVPEERDGKRFWFRGFYVLGEVFCTWWDDFTHLYTELLSEEISAYGLSPLFTCVRGIADISGLRFFSTEIAMDSKRRFLTVDYVNENCDMRLKSRHKDGVPDAVVLKIARRIASYAFERTHGRGT